MHEKAKAGELRAVNGAGGDAGHKQPTKRKRWDQSSAQEDAPTKKKTSSWDAAEAITPSNSRWDETPGRAKGEQTPGATPGQSTRQWDSTPGHATPGATTPGRDTPGHQATPSARRNRWDETPKTERGKFV